MSPSGCLPGATDNRVFEVARALLLSTPLRLRYASSEGFGRGSDASHPGGTDKRQRRLNIPIKVSKLVSVFFSTVILEDSE